MKNSGEARFEHAPVALGVLFDRNAFISAPFRLRCMRDRRESATTFATAISATAPMSGMGRRGLLKPLSNPSEKGWGTRRDGRSLAARLFPQV